MSIEFHTTYSTTVCNEIDGNVVWKHARFCDNPSMGFWQIFEITEVHILEGSEVSNSRVAGKQSIPLSVDSSEGRASFCYVALVEVSVVVWWYRRDVASTTTTVATTGPGY
ncbi:hypothetical protein HZH68_003309 [Vespula germanica]|uniref:Uncharacterized protein n=1 Tax=Vespula germanica TaxID=30212 RepID=A0A834NNW1_VESGE|nr:hypothetical protein HZH68_003309 [Vespula germanica]